MEVWKLIELILKSFQEHNRSSRLSTNFYNKRLREVLKQKLRETSNSWIWKFEKDWEQGEGGAVWKVAKVVWIFISPPLASPSKFLPCLRGFKHSVFKFNIKQQPPLRQFSAVVEMSLAPKRKRTREALLLQTFLWQIVQDPMFMLTLSVMFPVLKIVFLFLSPSIVN